MPYSNDFNDFLRENADAHRLYPSEKVWAGIHARLHPPRRWGLRALALLLAIPLSTSISEFQSVLSPDLPATAVSASPSLLADRSAVVERSEVHFSATPTDEPDRSPRVGPDDTWKSSLVKSLAAAAEIPLPANIPEQVAMTAIAAPAIQSNALTETATLAPDIENVVNSYQRQVHRPRFKWQLYVTPTVSYRRLQEDQKFIALARLSAPTAPAVPAPGSELNLQSVIRHRPDMGLQLGISGTYPVGKRLDWIAGLQFNVSKYDIEAYNYPSEVATIALMNSWGGASTVSTLTSFRSNGFTARSNWLRNYYYSVSVPLGLEWRILGKKQNHWGISATAQPTYVVGNRAYVISTDYQNYAEVPYLINKWNINLGLETYARFKAGATDFRIGPQVRYQALSSFKKGYPVQEHLYDFGIKVGMTLGK